MDNFSDEYPSVDFLKHQDLISKLEPYTRCFYKNQYSFVRMPNGDLGIRTKFIVNAGSDSLLDHREPVVIGLPSEDLEHCEPYVFPDRKNFPFEKFPHVNYPIGGMPPTLCLTREYFKDWYAEHTFGDFLCLIHEWFDDAAKDNLIKTKDGDFFESFRGHHVDEIMLRVPYEDSHLERASRAGSIYYAVKKIADGLYSSCISNIDYSNYGIGIILFRPSTEICDSWFVQYPDTLEELLEFIVNNSFNFEVDKLIEVLSKENCKAERFFFQLAFQRPVKVISKHTCIDYLSFSVAKSDLIPYNKNAKVKEVALFDTTTPEFANYLSDTKESISNKKILILGCGAIGSKLIYHLYRSGICNLTICDKDVMQPHNVCRHALASGFNLELKAEKIKSELQGMFFMNYSNVQTVTEDLLIWLPKTDLNAYDLIIDTSASASVFRCLDQLRDNISKPIVHFALSDAGKIGHVYVNNNQKIMLSDYYIQLMRRAITDCKISDWLKNEAVYNHDWVRIGEGCHSNTMILSDDIISIHTGIASNIIRNLFEDTPMNKAYLSFADLDYPGQIFTDNYEMSNMVSIPCSNVSGWQVRIPSDLLKEIRFNTKVASNKEVGGYLMGCIEEKYKTIYILHTFIPSNSGQGVTKLRLSNNGWKAEHDKVISRTSNMMTYLGDWHSHPVGSLEMSITDISTCYEIKVEEIISGYGICLITNVDETKAYLLD